MTPTFAHYNAFLPANYNLTLIPSNNESFCKERTLNRAFKHKNNEKKPFQPSQSHGVKAISDRGKMKETEGSQDEYNEHVIGLSNATKNPGSGLSTAVI